MSNFRFMPVGIGLAIAALPFALAFAVKAHADPVIAGSHYMEVIDKQCENRRICTARFSAIPSPGSMVKLENLSCKWASPTPLRRVEISITKGLRTYGQRFIGGDDIDQPSRVVNAPLYGLTAPMAFQPGTVPEVSFVLSGEDDIEFTCTIAGNLG
jgi:hypothetical protein